MAKYIVEHRFDTARELLDALTPWSSTLSLDGYIFRGHSNADYQLVPTSLRISSKEDIWDYSLAYASITGSTCDNDFSLAYVEYQLIRDFYRMADARGLHVPVSDRLRKTLHQKVDFSTMSTWIDGDKWLPDDILEVAAIAQHHGVPTRLLDWTYDPFVAAFFASKPSQEVEGDLCIWGLNARTIGMLENIGTEFPLKLVNTHYGGNPNLAAQSGLFTHWASNVPGVNSIASGEIKELPRVDRRPLDALLESFLSGWTNNVSENMFVKLILPKSQSIELACLLRGFNYGPAKIFPGYEGVAMELKERPFLKKKKSDSKVSQ